MTEGRGERDRETPDITIHDPDDVVGGVVGGGSGERATGTPDAIYDLSSVLFHALEGGASYDTYIQDAEREGDQELADFFARVRDEDSMRADEARRLIAERTPASGGSRDTGVSAEGVAAGVPPGTEPVSAPPGPGDVPPRRTEEEVPPRPEPTTDLPGTEPIKEETPTARTGEVPPPPEEVPPERAGEIPTAEEVPPPRAEGVPSAGEAPSGTPSQAPPGVVESPMPGDFPHEDMILPTPPPPRGTPGGEQGGTPPEPPPTSTGEAPRTGEERAGQEEEEEEEGEEDKGLIDRARDYLLGEGRERDYLGGEDRERESRER